MTFFFITTVGGGVQTCILHIGIAVVLPSRPQGSCWTLAFSILYKYLHPNEHLHFQGAHQIRIFCILFMLLYYMDSTTFKEHLFFLFFLWNKKTGFEFGLNLTSRLDPSCQKTVESIRTIDDGDLSLSSKERIEKTCWQLLGDNLDHANWSHSDWLYSVSPIENHFMLLPREESNRTSRLYLNKLSDNLTSDSLSIRYSFIISQFYIIW